MDRKPPPPPPPAGRSIPRMPPPPPKRSAPAAPAPPPAPEARTSGPPPSKQTNTQQLILAASSAAKLRDEQLQARVRYYNQDLATNKELDAITEQVVAELRALGQVVGDKPVQRSQADVEIELIGELRGALEKLMRGGRNKLLTRRIEEVQRRITHLFFQSELYARLAENAQSVPTATWPEQVLYFALKRQEAAIEAEIDALPVSDPAVRERAREELERFQKHLTNEFLSKTTPELERLLGIYRDVLGRFFAEVFPAELGEFAWEVIKESRVGAGTDLGYKITADRFHQFRETFDRKFLVHLVLNVQDPIAKRAAADAGNFREATLAFVADPHIHAEICGVINDALYDYLHGEGFLDLPTDWKRLLKDQ